MHHFTMDSVPTAWPLELDTGLPLAHGFFLFYSVLFSGLSARGGSIPRRTGRQRPTSNALCILVLVPISSRTLICSNHVAKGLPSPWGCLRPCDLLRVGLPTESLALFLNGVAVPGFHLLLQSPQVILQLSAADVLTVVNHSSCSLTILANALGGVQSVAGASLLVRHLLE